MSLHIVILDGPHLGQRFALVEGHRIGRKGAEIALDDPKVSNRHAQLVVREGQFFLQDLGSKNGIHIDAIQHTEVLLTAGLVFRIGRTNFEVIEVLSPASALLSLANAALKKAQNKPQPLTTLDPPLRLTFLQGLQAGTAWWIGYAPRRCGRKTLDLTLYEPEAPDLCFELIPTAEQGLMLRAASSDKSSKSPIRINGQRVRSQTLQNGDLITILNSTLEVSFDL